MFPTNYPIQAIHQWTSGPGECLLKVALRVGTVNLEEEKEKLRDKLDAGLKA